MRMISLILVAQIVPTCEFVGLREEVDPMAAEREMCFPNISHGTSDETGGQSLPSAPR